MAIATILHFFIYWQPQLCTQYPLGVLSAQPDSCARMMAVPFEIYYEWAPPTVMTLESHYE